VQTISVVVQKEIWVRNRRIGGSNRSNSSLNRKAEAKMKLKLKDKWKVSKIMILFIILSMLIMMKKTMNGDDIPMNS